MESPGGIDAKLFQFLRGFPLGDRARAADTKLINHFAQTVVDTIPPEHVTDYERLLQNVGQASTPEYQKRYRRFWAMNAAQLSPAFYATYFNTLVAAMS
ncbi:MAG: hypothetical protein WA603_08345 [Candidatus Acidiferrales bacterium]